jgi:methyl-accepting chemotaxis protein
MIPKNISVGGRLGLGFGLVGLLFAMVVWQYHHTLFGVINHFDILQETQAAKKTHFLNVHRYMLEARRSEKDFLSRKTLQYPGRVAEYVQLIDVESEKIKIIEEKTGSSPIGGKIHELIQVYHSAFKKIVAAWKINGLDHNSGLQGRFRNTIHDVEAQAKNFKTYVPHLEEEILTLRRREKDYLLRGDESYVNTVRQTAAKILSNIKLSQLSSTDKKMLASEIHRYEDDFLALVNHNNEIIKLTALMREAVHKIEPFVIIGVAEATTEMTTATKATRTQVQTRTALAILTTLVAIFLATWFAYYFSRSITRPVNTLTQLTELFAPPEENPDPADLKQKDEIIILTNAMGRMTGHLRDIIYYFNDHIVELHDMAETLEKNTNKTISPAEKKKMVASLKKMSIALEKKMGQMDV